MRWLVLVPLVMCLWPLGSGLPAWDAFPVPLDSWPVVWGRTLAVAAASGVLAVVMAAVQARSPLWTVLLVAALPPWLLTWSFASLDGPASVLEGFFPHGLPVLLAHTISGMALCSVFLCGSGSHASAFEAARLSGAGPLRRWWLRIQLSKLPLALGGTLVAVRTALDTTSWDLARWPGLANEFRAALDAGLPREALGAFVPWFALVLFALIWCSTNAQHWHAERDEQRGGPWMLLATVPLLAAALPFVGDLSLHDFLLLHGRQFGPDALRLAVVGLGAGVLALHARLLVDVSLRWSQVGLAAWGVLYFLPPPLFSAVVGDVGLILGLCLRVAFAGWAVGYLSGVMEDATQREARQLEAAAGQRRFGLGLPRLRVIGFGGLAAIMLALGELTVSARLAQPGDDPLAVSLLSALHYQRPGVVLLAIVPLLLATASVAWLLPRRCFSMLLAVLLVSCHETGPQDETSVIGGNGLTPGRFAYPRAMDIDSQTNTILVVDKRARIQRLASDGTPLQEWSTPTRKNGNPTGIFVDDDGTIFVADTHEHRVLVYESDGELRTTFGDYGEELGEFIYPTDIARDGQGRLWVSEYGGNDRIQVFADDYTPLFVAAEDHDFRRPQSLLWSPEHDVMLLSEANGHQLHVLSSEGELVRSIGGPGHRPGQFSYPYGLALNPEGQVLVAEFGGCRVHEVSLDTESFRTWSAEESNGLRYPWAVGCIDQRILVLDSGNHRILEVDSSEFQAAP